MRLLFRSSFGSSVVSRPRFSRSPGVKLKIRVSFLVLLNISLLD